MRNNTSTTRGNPERSNPQCPDTEQLAECLEPLSPDNNQLHAHLEHCESCQLILAHLAGQEQWWQDARQTLSVPQHETATRVVTSLCALSVGVDDTASADPLREHEVEQLKSLLQPACHPELLGRIGRYEIEQLIGRGGMGLVFRARDTQLHRVVAVKTLAVHLIPIGAARTRFVREARACASLVHPHIVPVHDVITEGPVPALVMQYVAGPTLEAWLAERGPISWRDTLRIGIQLSDALASAHEQNLVHRDIKPGNVLLEADGSRALLTDFGLVRTLDDATLTRSGLLAGTPDYMSPEQARGDTAEQSSDLFSLGSLFYAMLTGHPPFRAPGPMAVMNRICHEPHRPVTQLQPETPVELGRLVDRLLSKEPHRRHNSAAELRNQMQQLARAKSHLTIQHQKTRWRLIVAGSIGVMLLVMLPVLQAVGVFRSASRVNQDDRQSAPAANNDRLSQSVIDGKASGQNRSVTNGFVELHQIDDQLDAVKRETDRLSKAYARPDPNVALEEKPLFQNVQTEIQRIDSQIKQLESELRP